MISIIFKSLVLWISSVKKNILELCWY